MGLVLATVVVAVSGCSGSHHDRPAPAPTLSPGTLRAALLVPANLSGPWRRTTNPGGVERAEARRALAAAKGCIAAMRWHPAAQTSLGRPDSPELMVEELVPDAAAQAVAEHAYSHMKSGPCAAGTGPAGQRLGGLASKETIGSTPSSQVSMTSDDARTWADIIVTADRGTIVIMIDAMGPSGPQLSYQAELAVTKLRRH